MFEDLIVLFIGAIVGAFFCGYILINLNKEKEPDHIPLDEFQLKVQRSIEYCEDNIISIQSKISLEMFYDGEVRLEVLRRLLAEGEWEAISFDLPMENIRFWESIPDTSSYLKCPWGYYCVNNWTKGSDHRYFITNFDKFSEQQKEHFIRGEHFTTIVPKPRETGTFDSKFKTVHIPQDVPVYKGD